MFLIAGPCVIESEQAAIDTASAIREVAQKLNLFFIYKSSYDKANRSSGKSFRGVGLEQGLEILAQVKAQVGVPVLTDVHLPADVEVVAGVVDVLQTPAFLCRQTDLISAAAASGKPVNIKKGQFLSPAEMNNVVAKAKAAGGEGSTLVCERGVSFGYNNLVVDMRSLATLRQTDCPVVFDATSFRPATRCGRDPVRRSTGIHPCSGPSGGGCRGGWSFYGNASQSRYCTKRWCKCLAHERTRGVA